MATSTLLTPPFQWQPTLPIARSRTPSFTNFLQATRARFTSHSSTINTKALQTPCFTVRLSAVSHADSATTFDEDNQKKFYIFGGEGGVGKTNSAASLAVKFADHGHPTLLVSFNPIRCLSDIFDQDLTDRPDIKGLKSPLSALEVNLEEPEVDTKDGFEELIEEELIKEFGDGKIENLSASLHEAIKIWNLMLAFDLPKYTHLDTRVVFDTSIMNDAVLKLLFNPDNSDGTIVFGNTVTMTDISRLSEKDLKKVGQLIRGSTEYVITTIPTARAGKESARLHAILKEQKVPVRRLISNRIHRSSMDELCARLMIWNDPELSNLDLIIAPMFDWETRGISALKLMGDMLWK